MRTFAAAKVVIALAVSYQYAEKERFGFSKGRGGLILLLCVYEHENGGKVTLHCTREVIHIILLFKILN
jgi:hypothetical protein